MGDVESRGKNLIIGLRTKKLVSSFFKLSGASVAGRLIAIISLPVIARLYTPTELGVASQVQSIVGILIAGGGGSYHLAIPIPNGIANAKRLGVLSSLVNVSTFALLICGFLVTSAFSVNPLGLGDLFWFVPLMFLVEATSNIFLQFMVRNRTYDRISLSIATQSLIMAVSTIVFGMLWGGAQGVLLGTFLGYLSRGLVLREPGFVNLRIVPSARTTLTQLRRVARRYVKFPVVTTPTAVINSLGSNAAVLSIASLLGPHQAGIFALGEKFIMAPIGIVGQSLAQMYVGEFSSRMRTRPHSLIKLFVLYFIVALSLGSMIGILVYFTVPPLFTRFLDSQWEEAVPIVKVMAFGISTKVASMSVTRIFSILERQGIALVWNLCRLCSVVGSIIYSNSIGMSLVATVKVLVGSMILFDVLVILLACQLVYSKSRGRF